ncbi:MAG: hypothetical protein ACXWKX_06515 [Caulobacteraceae bacterium]
MASLPALAVAVAAALGPPAQPAFGDNIVVIRVGIVMVPRESPGDCVVRGRVEEVRLGHAFEPGQGVMIRVPCMSHAPGRLPPPRRGVGRPPLDAEVLSLHKRAIARIDDMGGLIWRRSARPYGRYGYVDGYRVLDAVFLPVKPAGPR